MIKRINLLEKKAFSFTYLKLMQICLIVIALNGLLIGYQYYNVMRMEKKIQSKNVEYTQFEEKRDELLKKPVKKRVVVGEFQSLVDKIEDMPSWSKLLDEVTKRLPNTVWITNFKTIGVAVSTAVAPTQNPKSFRKKTGEDANQKTVAPPTQTIQVEISGLSRDMRNITEFATKLSGSDYFGHATLTNSNKQTFGYVFTIKSEVKKHVQ